MLLGGWARFGGFCRLVFGVVGFRGRGGGEKARSMGKGMFGLDVRGLSYKQGFQMEKWANVV